MPLIKSASKRALSHNIEAEMHAGKPKDQSIAIAYSVKTRNKRKKMAEGGTVKQNSQDKSPPSAKTESRPMPQRMDDTGKPAINDHVLDQPTVAQARRPSKTPLSRPPIRGSDAFSVRYRDEVEDAEHAMSKMPPEAPHQPSRMMDEEGPDRRGPMVPALKMKRMAHGGMLPAGSEDDMAVHPEGLEEDDDQMRPSMDEYMSGHEQMLAAGGDVRMYGSSGGDPSRPDKGYGAIVGKPNDEEEMQMAEGGMIDLDEMEDERHASIAAAIMAKRDRMKAGSDSDEDRMMRMAEGGKILSHGSMDTHESVEQSDLSRNADEDANEEDQASFDALRKENYSETPALRSTSNPMDAAEHGDSREMDRHDEHDHITRMRMKMKRQRQF